MREGIFRKKSLDKIKSPENLNDYIRVSNPGVWLLLASIIVLLAGACIWSVFGHIDSTAAAYVRVENGVITCYADDRENIETGMTVKIGSEEGTITEIGEKDANGYACIVRMDSVPEDGTYVGEIVLQRIRPVSFILN